MACPDVLSPRAVDYQRIDVSPRSPCAPRWLGPALFRTGVLAFCVGAGYLFAEIVPEKSGYKAFEQPARARSTALAVVYKGNESKPRPRTCTCPPSEVIWACSDDEFQSIMNGTRCPFFRHRVARNETLSCPSCGSSPQGLQCRACSSNIPVFEFCLDCIERGLNDVGCSECSGKSAATAGNDADIHGCRASAGYTWCEAVKSCIRPWKEGLKSQAALARRCSQLGADVDEHGCRASAGYSWCETASLCIRPWEHKLTTRREFIAYCNNKTILGSGRDEHGCIPSAGYTWCEAMRKCIRPWEHKLRTEDSIVAACRPAFPLGSDSDRHGCIASAGYSWCESMKSCIRPWEHDLHSTGAFSATCQGL